MSLNTVKATLPAETKILNRSRIIHDWQLRNCVTTVLTLVAVGFSARL